MDNREVKWGDPDAPKWTIEGALYALSSVHEAFRKNGYALTMHGSVLVRGQGNDLDLIAVPMEFIVTPPEQMEGVMCELLDAKPVPREPVHGALNTWARACILRDGRQIDIEYRRPAPANEQREMADILAGVLAEHGYYLVVSSFPQNVTSNFVDTFAVPVRTEVTSPEKMDELIRAKFGAQALAEPKAGTFDSRVYEQNGLKVGICYLSSGPNRPLSELSLDSGAPSARTNRCLNGDLDAI